MPKPAIAGPPIAAIMLALAASVASAQGWQDAVDYTKLKSRVGAALPAGAGGTVSIVEAPISGAYLLDVNNGEFTAGSDPDGVAVSLVDMTQSNTAISGHATNTVGSTFIGNTASMAPSANSVVMYEAVNWWSAALRYSTSQEPALQPYRVQNHSWVGTSNVAASDQSILRRFDYLIETGEMTAVVGTANSLAGHPNLMVHSYNAIVAGRSDGVHSRGQTQSIYGPGRYRPDLVAPASVTSAATARISSAAAMLHESGAGTDAVRSEAMKAILLAGATKQEFAGFIDPKTSTLNPWDRTATRPLDDLLGAGELNVYNSYLIQQGGKNPGSASQPTAAVSDYGWDYQDYKNQAAVGDIFYNFHIPAGSTAAELSIILAWNVQVLDTDFTANFAPQESLPNLNLRLYDSTASFRGTLIDSSLSTVDNIEHIYQTDLGPGTYTLVVSGAANWDYALAWRTATLFDQASGDFDENGVVDGGDFLTWQRNLGMLLGASHADGDADGDGDVDLEDYGILQAAPSSGGGGATSAGGSVAGGASSGSPANAVPEPAAIGLAVAGGLLVWTTRRARRRYQRTIA